MTVASLTTGTEKPELLSRLDAVGIDTLSINSKHSYSTRTIFSLRKLLKDGKFQLVCTHDYRSAIICFLAKTGINVHWLGFSRGWTFENPKIILFHVVETFLFNFSRSIVAVSKFQKSRVFKLVLPHKSAHVVHNVIDLKEIHELGCESIHEKFNIPESSKIVVSAGRFSPEKGQKYLIEAACELTQKDTGLYFILFGDGPDYKNLKNIVKGKNLEKQILLPGHCTNVLSYLKSGVDILVNPSTSEGLPNIILEAMALEIPVIATRVGGVPEIVQSNDTGILVEAKDSSAIAIAIVQLLSNHELKDQLIRNAKANLKKHFNFIQQTKLLENIYKSII